VETCTLETFAGCLTTVQVRVLWWDAAGYNSVPARWQILHSCLRSIESTMSFRIAIVLCFACGTMISALAQDAANESESSGPSRQVAESTSGKDTPPAKKSSHWLAIEEFFAVMNMKQTSDKTIDQMLAMQIRQQPQLASYKDVMTAFLRKYVSYEALKDDMIKLYQAEFTEDEIRAMTAFYRTPAGQKAVAKLPKLTASGAQLGMQRVQSNMAELQAAIAKRDAELKAKSPKAEVQD
jgi:hypothetical protein